MSEEESKATSEMQTPSGNPAAKVPAPVTHGEEKVSAPAASNLPPGLALFLQFLFVAVAALGVYLFMRAARDGETRRVCAPLCSIGPDYAARNRVAPDFELPSLSGGALRLSDYRGKVVVLNFWTKTCKPCLEEMPSLNQLGKILSGRDDVVLLTVNTDASIEDANATLQSVLGEELTFKTMNDPESNIVAGKFGTKLYPETWIIDPQGVIRARLDGPRDWLNLAPLIIQFAETLTSPVSCEVEFNRRVPSGSYCNDIPAAG